ncbi:hypothetical protein SEA_KOZIE_29 [Microbacterium phage Kozie]|uniref:Uncharacterized protein n=1 Tax=Microbacterium phage Kozie TaxID=2885981 RepID=A0AAE8Y817_9CAUD|nr:hypothetical protein QC998_gp29 [Microbacterium phage Kozie]UDL16225.1 hypothetical protein SEA_KOZIE_29 [Microbacterium phage Kozie]
MAKVKVDISRGATLKVIGPMTDRAAYRAAQATRGRAMANIRAAGRIDTGAMIAGLQVRLLTRSGSAVAYAVYSTAPYTVFQEFGTRAHGPRSASVMVFTPKGGGATVFAKWVRGVTPAYFMTRAYLAAKPSDAVG